MSLQKEGWGIILTDLTRINPHSIFLPLLGETTCILGGTKMNGG